MTSGKKWTAKLPASTVVLGACGGAGATTTALGLANTAAADGASIVAVDTTPAGGDIAERGADSMMSDTSLEKLLKLAAGGPLRDDIFGGACSHTGVGARILHRNGNQMATHIEYRAVDEYLRSRAAIAVYDAGHRPRAAYLTALLGDSLTPIVLAVPCRADAFNRLRAALESISSTFGEPGLARTVVAVSNQDSAGWQVDVKALRQYLDGRVWGVEEIPYDPHLGMGIVIDHNELAPATVEAYLKLGAATIAAVAR